MTQTIQANTARRAKARSTPHAALDATGETPATPWATTPAKPGKPRSTQEMRTGKGALSYKPIEAPASPEHGKPVPNEAGQAEPGAPRQTKTALVLALLERPEGASLAQLTEATGW